MGEGGWYVVLWTLGRASKLVGLVQITRKLNRSVVFFVQVNPTTLHHRSVTGIALNIRIVVARGVRPRLVTRTGPFVLSLSGHSGC